MDKSEIGLWNQAVVENIGSRESVKFDRTVLEKKMEAYLKKFFDFDGIDFSENLDVVTLRWDYGHHPTFYADDKIVDLGMKWKISHRFSENHGDGVIIIVYPRGE